MKKAMRACLGGLSAVLLSAMAVRAEKPETDYVVLTLPADWELAEPMRFKPLGGGNLPVRHKGDDLLVGIVLSFWYEGMKGLREAYESEIREGDYTVERSDVSGNVVRVDISGDGDFRGRHYGAVGEGVSSQVVIYGTAPSKRAGHSCATTFPPVIPHCSRHPGSRARGGTARSGRFRGRHSRRSGPARAGSRGEAR